MQKNIDFRGRLFLAWWALSFFKKVTIFLLSLLMIFMLPTTFYFQQLSEKKALQQSIQQEKQNLFSLHQQLQTIKQKQRALTLTPFLARQLLPIDQFIFNQNGLKVEQLQWQMAEAPQLMLLFSTNFLQLNRFLHQLLRKYPHFQLSFIQIEKDNKGDNLLQIVTHWQLPKGFLNTLEEDK